MGTRADFYVGRGETAEWLGSVAWDGYPDGLRKTPIFRAQTEQAFRDAVRKELAKREDGTFPNQGWPWPWENSQTTDFAYAFDGTKVHASCFGHAWFDPLKPQPENDDDSKPTIFPDMTSRQKVTFGKRSGVMVIGGNGPVDIE